MLLSSMFEKCCQSHLPTGLYEWIISRLYDERQPIEPLYPATKPSEGEVPGEDVDGDEKQVLEHAPPGLVSSLSEFVHSQVMLMLFHRPCYEGLTNNVSTPLMRLKLNSWSEGTPDYVSHRVLRDYIQDTSRKCGVDEVTIYGARVVNVRKDGSAWQVTWSTIYEDPVTKRVEKSYKTSVRGRRIPAVCIIADSCQNFDAVIVGSGHYHAPRVPDLPGLAESKGKWPARIMHSKAYRKPIGFEGKVRMGALNSLNGQPSVQP